MTNYLNILHLGKKRFPDYLKKIAPLYKLIMMMTTSSFIYRTSRKHKLKLPQILIKTSLFGYFISKYYH